ncbi:hypothetical protein GQ457_14G014370 [Hibiscus cannabinus]
MAPIRDSTGVLDREIWEFQAYRGSVSATHGRSGFREVEDSKRVGSGLGQWVKGQLSRTPSVASMNCRRSDVRLLLGVMGAPLALVHVSSTDPLSLLNIKD